MDNKKLIKSPLNYTGGKFKLLPQILPLFPEEIDCFYDVFCGGANISVNVNASNIIASDINLNIISLYNYFKKNTYACLYTDILKIIEHYGLSNSKEYGYDFYKCNSSEGLGSFNKDYYSKLKKDYNDDSFNLFNKEIMFYVLIIFGFNNQIRFNRKNEFNISVGKRDFNSNIENNFKSFHQRLSEINISFENKSFIDFNIDDIKENDFIYADPPYLISTATYNEADGWNEDIELKLLKFLDELNNKNIKFALSNVLEHKNKENKLLKDWAEANKYNVNYLNFSYRNSSYQGKDTDSVTKEVLITNYNQ